MRPHILKPYTVSASKGMITVTISSIMAFDETTAVDKGLMLLTQEEELSTMRNWDVTATLIE